MFGVFLSIVMFASQSTMQLFRIEQERRDIRNEIAALRELYEYKDRTVTGDDVLLAVKKYTRLYQIEIELGEVGSGNWLVLTDRSTDEEWNVENIRKRMGDNVYNTYKSELVISDTDVIEKLVFRRE